MKDYQIDDVVNAPLELIGSGASRLYKGIIREIKGPNAVVQINSSGKRVTVALSQIQNAGTKGSGTVSVQGTSLKYDWQIMDNMMSITVYWPKERDNDFKFIAAAERAATKEVASKSGHKFSISGGSGSVGNRNFSGRILNAAGGLHPYNVTYADGTSNTVAGSDDEAAVKKELIGKPRSTRPGDPLAVKVEKIKNANTQRIVRSGNWQKDAKPGSPWSQKTTGQGGNWIVDKTTYDSGKDETVIMLRLENAKFRVHIKKKGGGSVTSTVEGQSDKEVLTRMAAMHPDDKIEVFAPGGVGEAWAQKPITNSSPSFQNGCAKAEEEVKNKVGEAGLKVENAGKDWEPGDNVKTPVGEGTVTRVVDPLVWVDLKKGGSWMGNWQKLQYIPIQNADGVKVAAKRTTTLESGASIKVGEEYTIRSENRDSVFLHSPTSSFTVTQYEFKLHFKAA